MQRLCTLLLAVSVAASSVRVAAADEPTTSTVDPKITEARRLFAEGAALAELSRWSEALEKFQASAALRPHATTTYDIGYCERSLGHPTRARKAFLQALAEDAAAGGTELSAELHASIPKLVIEVEARQALVTLTVVPEQVTITVDAVPLEIVSVGSPPRALAGTRSAGPGERVPAATFLLELDAGTHEIVVVGLDGRSKITPVTLAPGASSALEIELPPAPLADPSHEISVFGARESMITGLVVVGAIGLGVGSAYGLSSISRWKHAKEACPDPTACPDGRGAELSHDARVAGNVSTVAFAISGVALLSAGVTWLLTAPTKVRVSGAIDPRGASLSVGMAF